MDTKETNNSPNERAQLLRLLYMLLFAGVLYLALIVLIFVVIVQFIFALFASEPNSGIQRFSRDLAHYIYQIVLYLTYNEDRLPYPFSPLYDEVVVEDVPETVIAEYQDLSDDKPNGPNV